MERINLLTYALLGLDKEISEAKTLRAEIVNLMQAESIDVNSPAVIQKAREVGNVLRAAMGKTPLPPILPPLAVGRLVSNRKRLASAGKRKPITAAGRRKISRAMKIRWAEWRKAR